MSSRMVRELADVTDELRAVPPPPLPVLPDPYSMRFVDPDTDATLISDYMNRPHLAETWQYNYPADQWRRHLEIQFEGSYSRPYFYCLHGQPFGYVELFRAARDDLATVYAADPYDVGLHGAVLEPESLEKGHTQFCFHHMVATVFSGDPHCRRIMGDTGVGDTYGRRFWQRVGGVLVGEPYVARWGRTTALFSWPRTPHDVPVLREPAATGHPDPNSAR